MLISSIKTIHGKEKTNKNIFLLKEERDKKFL
jgi:hypothetical protein